MWKLVVKTSAAKIYPAAVKWRTPDFLDAEFLNPEAAARAEIVQLRRWSANIARIATIIEKFGVAIIVVAACDA